MADKGIGTVSGASAAHFLAPPRTSSDAAEAARALGIKLQCRSGILIGCVRAPIVSGLDSLTLTGFDTRTVVAEAGAAGAEGTWSEREAGGPSAEELAGRLAGDTLLVVDACLMLEEDGMRERVRELLATAPAAVLVDPDGRFAEDIGDLVAAAEDASLQVVHLSFVRSPRAGSFQRLSPYVVVVDGHDPRSGHVLAAGARGLATDPLVDVSADLGRPLQVCVASYEVVGPTRNGGIGTANTSLARALAHAGHAVTLLFTGFAPDGPVDEEAWKRHYSEQGIEFEVLAHGFDSWVRTPHANVRRAYELYAWLSQRAIPFDIVHFPECQGHAYYAVQARRQGIAFHETLFVAGVHSSTRWCEEANRELPRSIDALVDDHLERTSVELADVVISPSAYMLDYMQERDWKLPERRFVQQYVLPTDRTDTESLSPPRVGAPIHEIVFFGRLEVRKGVETFCDALDLLAEADGARELRITFIGRPEHILGEPSVDYLAHRARAWPWSYEVAGSLGHDEAMARLRSSGSLGVMPSTVDNSPNTVSEALGLRVPFVCSRSGGTGELIDPRDLLDVTFPGLAPAFGVAPPPSYVVPPAISAQALFKRIHAQLESTVYPRFAIDHHANERLHVKWNVGAVAHHAATRRRRNGPGREPNLSIGVLHRDQATGLATTLEALAAQKHELLDVTVVDDNSVTEEGLRQVDWAERFCTPLGWTVIRRERRHVAQAREQMVANGRGDAHVFLRCSETISGGAVRLLREVLQRTGADIVSCAVVDHRSVVQASAPDGLGSRAPTIAPIAGPPLAGTLYPAFSAGPYAISVEAIERLRGFAVDARGPEADVDLLNRALLAGCSLQVIPEPLAEVTHSDGWESVRQALSIDLAHDSWDREGLLRVTRPFANLAPGPLMSLPGLYSTLHVRSAAERVRALYGDRDVVGADGEPGRRPDEYIAYLENEHHLLSSRIHALEDARNSTARRVVRRARRLAAELRSR